MFVFVVGKLNYEIDSVDLKLLNSKSEARRVIGNREVKLNGKKAEDARLEVSITDERIL